MATATTAPLNGRARRPLLTRIGAFFKEAADLLAASHEVERLLGYSDAELARRGLRREEVGPRIFNTHLARY